jgi:hypothetical protein
MSVILRSEKGSPLTSAEIDGNFSSLQAQIDEAMSVVVAEGIAGASVVGNQMTLTGTLGSTFGPFTLPPGFVPRGAWATGGNYLVGNVVTNGASLYHCQIDHVAGASFATDLAAGKWVLVAAPPTAAQVSYDHSTSGLTATNVKAAIDEIVARLVAHGI